MNFINVIKHRKLPFKLNIEFEDDHLIVQEFNISIGPLPLWEYSSKEVFNSFKKEFELSVFDDVSPSEAKKIRAALHPPAFILRKGNSKNNNETFYIAGYFVPRIVLNGGSNLHLRSLNKYEQMWASYIVKTHGRNNEIKSLVIGNSIASLSGPIFFGPIAEKETTKRHNRLRILMIEMGEYVLICYIIDNPSYGDNEANLADFMNSISIGGADAL